MGYNMFSTRKSGVLKPRSFKITIILGGTRNEYQTSCRQSCHQECRARGKDQSGIILTGTAKEKPQVCEVVAVGPGGLVDGKEVKMTVKVGDKVLIAKYAGTEVKVDDEECVIVRQSDILAVVE